MRLDHPETYYDQIIESLIKGNFEDARKLSRKLNKEQRKTFYKYLDEQTGDKEESRFLLLHLDFA